MKVAIESNYVTVEEPKFDRRVNWDSASEEAKSAYKLILEQLLSNVHVPDCIDCLNPQCQLHKTEIEEYTLAILQSIESAGRKCLPIIGGSKAPKKNV